jgi:hypothetical protein
LHPGAAANVTTSNLVKAAAGGEVPLKIVPRPPDDRPRQG